MSFDLEVVFVDGKPRLKRPEPAAPEPSGLWACWCKEWENADYPGIERVPAWGDAAYQLPADMTAREIAALTVGDCRRMATK